MTSKGVEQKLFGPHDRFAYRRIARMIIETQPPIDFTHPEIGVDRRPIGKRTHRGKLAVPLGDRCGAGQRIEPRNEILRPPLAISRQAAVAES